MFTIENKSEQGSERANGPQHNQMSERSHGVVASVGEGLDHGVPGG
jgi:hypothetical protein